MKLEFSKSFALDIVFLRRSCHVDFCLDWGSASPKHLSASQTGTTRFYNLEDCRCPKIRAREKKRRTARSLYTHRQANKRDMILALTVHGYTPPYTRAHARTHAAAERQEASRNFRAFDLWRSTRAALRISDPETEDTKLILPLAWMQKTIRGHLWIQSQRGRTPVDFQVRLTIDITLGHGHFRN